MTTVSRGSVHFMERAGWRGMLARRGTASARAATGGDVELFFDDIWIRRVGDRFYGDKPWFDYEPEALKSWNAEHESWARDGADIWLHKYAPQSGDIVIDAGAGFGVETLRFSRAVGQTGLVVAVEGNADTYRRLVKTCKWSKLHNVIPVDLTLGAKQTAETQRLDDVVAILDLPRISFLKLSVAGAEIAALDGMPETLRKTARIAVACHDFRAVQREGDAFRTRKRASAILREAGFRLSRRVNDPRPAVADVLYGVREDGGK